MKEHCISYPTESLIFCKLLLFFLIVYSYKFICVYILSFYANITKIRTRSYHYRVPQLNPDKESQVAV